MYNFKLNEIMSGTMEEDSLKDVRPLTICNILTHMLLQFSFIVNEEPFMSNIFVYSFDTFPLTSGWISRIESRDDVRGNVVN